MIGRQHDAWHPGRACRLQPWQRILDDDARAGGNRTAAIERAVRREVGRGIGFAARYVVRGNDDFEAAAEVGLTQNVVDVVPRRARTPAPRAPFAAIS